MGWGGGWAVGEEGVEQWVGRGLISGVGRGLSSGWGGG